MTELKTFLTSFYDSLSAAELEALQHGQSRLAELLESGTVPPDASVPVYHATNMEVTLDVGLEARQTESELEMHVTAPTTDDGTRLSFTVELYDLLDRGDLDDLEYDDILPDGEVPDDGDDEPVPDDDIVDVETLQLGSKAKPPRWYEPEPGTPGAARLFDSPKSAVYSSLIESSGERADAVRDFVDETDFEASLLLEIASVGPNSCYTAVAVSDLAVEDGVLVGTAAAVDTSEPDEECLSVIRYPSVLVRVPVSDDRPETGRLSITDGMGNEATVDVRPASRSRARSADRAADETDDTDGGRSDRALVQPVDVIDGLEPRSVELLRSREVETIEDLVALEPAALAEMLGDETEAITAAEARRWLEEARGLEAILSAVESEQPVELVDGIGPKIGARLREAGIEQLTDLVATPPEKIAAIVSTDTHSVSNERARKWLEEAVRRLEEAADRPDDRQ